MEVSESGRLRYASVQPTCMNLCYADRPVSLRLFFGQTTGPSVRPTYGPSISRFKCWLASAHIHDTCTMPKGLRRDFLYGFATASAQIEGGGKESEEESGRGPSVSRVASTLKSLTWADLGQVLRGRQDRRWLSCESDLQPLW